MVAARLKLIPQSNIFLFPSAAVEDPWTYKDHERLVMVGLSYLGDSPDGIQAHQHRGAKMMETLNRSVFLRKECQYVLSRSCKRFLRASVPWS
ncbi:hypothetical protein VNO78_16074 [Psophocarpus tetragonolobus]|uniref:Uncharacterized protein n=1 Tax=Psophocarpus tetragonolobus TaxID=3891 RepID=A0AAN9SHM6_PSOTE